MPSNDFLPPQCGARMSVRRPPSAVEAVELGAREFLRIHRRIVSDFERSLKNSRQFIKLAHRSLEREPQNTVHMLEQILEIDLLGHVTRQFEEFESVLARLPPDLAGSEPAAPDEGAQFQSLRLRYEDLLRDAESQAEEIQKLLSALTAPH